MLQIVGTLQKIKKSEYTNKDGEVLPKIELEMIAPGKTLTVYVQKELHESIEDLEEGKDYKIPVKTFVNKGINKSGQAYGFLNISIDGNIEEA